MARFGRSPGNCSLTRVVVVLLTLSGTARADLPFVGTNAGAPIWGGSILFSDALGADIASSGCRTVRINFRLDGNATWNATLLSKYDTIIQNARNHNLEILGIFSNETTSGGQSAWNQNYNTTGLNSFTYDYAANAWLLIDRYRDDIKLFEVWNEPSCWSVDPNTNPLNPGCSYIWPKCYANLLAETYKKVITEGGANYFTTHGISLVSGGLFAHDIGGSFSTARDYMTQVYAETGAWNAFETLTGRRYPWDYFGYHFYLNGGSAVSTSELASYFNDIRSMKSIYNDATDILVTEFGWTTQGVGLQGQADNLRDAYDWMRTQSDIASAYWYQWNDGDPNGDWGLVYSIGNPKPSYYEFADQCGVVGAPSANFSADPLSGEAPLTVQFTDQSGGDVDTWNWDFGDTGTSTTADPQHTYALPGDYTVSLTVTGPGGNDTETKTDLITVTAPPAPGDFDSDGDVDEDDVSRFLGCITGRGVTSIPPGCEIGVASLPPPALAWEGADAVASLTRSISGSDLLNGMTGTIEAGGFHSATPGGNAGGLADLTDGAVGSNVEAVLVDYPGGNPPNSGDPQNRALQVRYDFSLPLHLEAIRVFAANVTSPGDGRVFQNYDVYTSTVNDPSFNVLAESVTTGPFGRSNHVNDSHPDYLGATATSLTAAESGPIAAEVDSLRFVFYPVTNITGLYLDQFHPGDTGDTDSLMEAFVSSIVKEIDVFEYTGAVPAASNLADLDGDGDADQEDFGIIQRCLSGPFTLADPTCAD